MSTPNYYRTFSIGVNFIDCLDYSHGRTHHEFYSLHNAVEVARRIGACEDVLSLDVVDCTTGEVMLTIEHGKETYKASEVE